MELPIYETLKEFKEYYLDALLEFPELNGNKLKLLRKYLKTYEKERQKADFFYLIPNDKLLQNISNSNEIKELYINSLKTELEISGIITLFADYTLVDSGEISQQEYLEDIQKQNILNHNYRNFIKENPLYENECKYNGKYFENIDIITNFIIEEIQNEKNVLLRFHNYTPQTNEIPDVDYSGNDELKPKEKLILLDKLGVIKFLTDKLDVSDNATHLAEMLGAITGIDNKKGTLTGYCNYLIRPDHSNKNSPYFSENTVKKATQIYNTFRIKDKAD